MRKSIFALFLFIQLISVALAQDDRVVNPTGSEIIREEERRAASNRQVNYRLNKNRLSVPVIPKELKEKLEITKADKHEYQPYLKGSKIKIFKLWNNQCHLGKIIDVEKDKDCIEITGYEVASLYNFESKDYLPQVKGNLWTNGSFYPTPTIGLSDGYIYALNFPLTERSSNHRLTQILMKLNADAIKDLDKNDAAIKTLERILLFNEKGQPIWQENIEDYKRKGVIYSERFPVELNQTYLLRSVYVDNQGSAYPRNREIIYVFQVAKFEDNIATILWKRISSNYQ